MADTKERRDPPCYNCGQLGHMFNACTEPTRNPPAGLEASRARERNRNNSPGRNGSFSSRQGKAPVITRYSHPGSSYNVSSSPSYPNPPPGYPYPPPSHGYGGQPHMADHGSHGYYSGPSHHGFSPQHSPYGSAPPNQPYTASYPPSYGGHHVSQGNLAPHPSSYPQGPSHPYQHPPPPSYPYPPPSHSQPESMHGYNPHYYQPNHSDYQHKSREFFESHPPPPSLPPPPPPPGTYESFPREPHSGIQRQSEPGYRDGRPGIPEHHSQPPRNERSQKQARHDAHRQQRDRLNHGGKRNQNQQQTRRRDKSKDHRRRDQLSRSRSNQSPEPKPNCHDSNISSEPPVAQQRSSGIDEISHESTISSHVPTPVSDLGSDCDQDSTWDERTVFLEMKPSKEADPIAQPLPNEHNGDDHMMPPAYGSTGLISKYITSKNVDDFSQSVRETKQWKFMKDRIEFADPKTIQIANLEFYLGAVHTADEKFRNGRVGNPQGSDKRKVSQNDVDKHRATDKRKRNHDGHNANGRHQSDFEHKRPKLSEVFERRSSGTYFSKGISSPESGELLEGEGSIGSPRKQTFSPKVVIEHSHTGGGTESAEKDSRPPGREQKAYHETEAPASALGTKAIISKTITHTRSNLSKPAPPVQSRIVQNEPRKPHPLPPRPPGPLPSLNHKGPVTKQSSRNPELERRARRNSVTASQPISVKKDDESLDSELDPIDLELLGMAPSNDSDSDDEKQKPRNQQDNGKKHVEKGRTKNRRRQNTNSVYGRRW